MARTSKAKSGGANGSGNGRAKGHFNAGLMDWFVAHNELRRTTRNLPRTPEIQNYINFLWPAALDYYSPLNPIFLNESTGLDPLNAWPIWMSRDGLVPLLWFFKVHPTPGRFHQKILISDELTPYVPDAWRENMGTYRIVSTVREPLPKERKFLITGLLMDTYVSYDHLEEQLKQAVELVGEDVFKKSEILAFLPPRVDSFGGEHRHEFHTQCVFKIASYLGTHAHSLPWRKLDSMDQLEGYEVLEFNEKLLCSDSYFKHMALFRGARLLGESAPEVKSGQQLVSLSPYHGVLITEQMEGKCMLQHVEEKEAARYIEKFAEAMRSEANKRFPWPNWFAEWTRVLEHQS